MPVKIRAKCPSRKAEGVYAISVGSERWPGIFVDGSVHVTNGGFNPVLTIMAIAYRASEFINANWKPS